MSLEKERLVPPEQTEDTFASMFWRYLVYKIRTAINPPVDPYTEYRADEIEKKNVEIVIDKIRKEFSTALTDRDYYNLTVNALKILRKRKRVRIDDLRLEAILRASFNNQ